MKILFELEVHSPEECGYCKNGLCTIFAPYEMIACGNNDEFPEFCMLRRLDSDLQIVKKNILGGGET